MGKQEIGGHFSSPSHLQSLSSSLGGANNVLSVSLLWDVYKGACFISPARPFRGPNVKKTCPKPFSTVNQNIKQRPERIRTVPAGGRSGVWKLMETVKNSKIGLRSKTPRLKNRLCWEPAGSFCSFLQTFKICLRFIPFHYSGPQGRGHLLYFYPSHWFP